MAEEIKLSKIGELLRGNEPLLTMVFGAYCTEHNDIAQDFFNFLFEKEDIIVYSMVTENCVIQSEEGKKKKKMQDLILHFIHQKDYFLLRIKLTIPILIRITTIKNFLIS